MTLDTREPRGVALRWGPVAVALPAGARAVLGQRVSAGTLAALAFCLAHLALWGGAFALAFAAPRLDGAEQLVWAQSLQAGYWKHPPLPSWIVHGLQRLFGPSAALTYVAGQACIVTALGIAWRLGCEVMPWRRSLAALALSSLIVFYNAGAEAFNHDLALLPFVAATILLFHRAVRTGRWTFWLLTGLFAGLALLTKYIALLHLTALAIYLVADPGARTRRALQGALLAAGVAAMVVAPHVVWLFGNDFAPLRYARATAEAASAAYAHNRVFGIADFIVGLLVRLLPLALVIWFALPRAERDGLARLRLLANPTPDRLFLWVVGLAPLALVVLYSLFSGTHLLQRWGISSLLLAGWLMLDAWPARMDDRGLRRLFAGVAAIHLLLCVAVTVIAPRAAAALRVPGRINFPAQALAEAARRTWYEQTDAPLRLVVADSWIGGNLASQWRDAPAKVLLDGMAVRSPWVPGDAVHACGALVVIDDSVEVSRDPRVDSVLASYLHQADKRGAWMLRWPGHAGDAAPVRTTLRWGVIRPTPGASCPL